MISSQNGLTPCVVTVEKSNKLVASSMITLACPLTLAIADKSASIWETMLSLCSKISHSSLTPVIPSLLPLLWTSTPLARLPSCLQRTLKSFTPLPQMPSSFANELAPTSSSQFPHRVPESKNQIKTIGVNFYVAWSAFQNQGKWTHSLSWPPRHHSLVCGHTMTHAPLGPANQERWVLMHYSYNSYR